MPKAKVTGTIVSHIWDDDDSRSDYEIKMRTDDQGSEVWLENGSAVVVLRPESWPEIRDQIQAMMDEIEVES